MSAFEFENRTCGTCGMSWQALTFWDEDVPCGDCNLKAYEHAIAEMNSTRPFKILSIGGACPTQAEGLTSDDRPFYFRARHGEWRLEVGEVGDPADYCQWPEEGAVVAAGDDQSNGWMENDDVLAILDAHLS
jgi:hypothetical protein